MSKQELRAAVDQIIGVVAVFSGFVIGLCGELPWGLLVAFVGTTWLRLAEKRDL